MNTVGKRLGTKKCASCGTLAPLSEFMRRVGQPYFVNAGRAWPAEPLVPQVEMAACVVCFGTSVIRESVPSWERDGT